MKALADSKILKIQREGEKFIQYNKISSGKITMFMLLSFKLVS